jgi:hypothetical protein
MKYTDKNSIDDLFRSRLEDLQKKPSSGVWENVAKNIDKSGKTKAFNGLSRLIYASASVLVIVAAAYFAFTTDYFTGLISEKSEKNSIAKSQPSGTNTPELAENKLSSSSQLGFGSAASSSVNNNQSGAGSTASSSVNFLNPLRTTGSGSDVNKNDFVPGDLSDMGISTDGTQNNSGLISKISDQEETPESNFLARDKSRMDKIASMFHNISNTLLSSKVPDTSHINRENKSREELFKMKGFHIAPVYQLNSKWISKQNTYEAFGKYKLAYKIGLGNAYGVAAGYDFSTRFGIQIEYIMQSEHGQDYEDIINRKPMKRSVVLNYMQIPMIIKLKSSMMSGLTNKPIAVNYIAGLQYGMLKSASMELNGNNTDIKNRFLDYDFSAIFGIETDIFLTSRFFLSTGLRFEYGLLDINASGWKIKNGGKSQNILSGMTAGLHYMVF